MWSICRDDRKEIETRYGKAKADRFGLFEVQAAYRKKDLDIEEAQTSGFVGPDDKLVIVSPGGKVSAV